jgi:hypothetical protein
MANYYDNILEDFELDDFGESFDDDLFDEANIITDRPKLRKRPISIPSSIGKASNFGSNIMPSTVLNGSFATKAELKRSLNSISAQVNDIKKTNLNLAATIKRLDGTYESVIKAIAKKDKAQDGVTSNAAMMSMMSAIVNKPTLKKGSITLSDKDIVIADDAVQIDLTKTLLFTMIPTMMNGSGDNNMMMPLLMIMLLGDNNSKAGNSSSDIMLPMMMMMMMKK